MIALLQKPVKAVVAGGGSGFSEHGKGLILAADNFKAARIEATGRTRKYVEAEDEPTKIGL